MTADLAVLIPTHLRHEKLPGLLDNVREATFSTHRVYLIVENTDRATIESLWHLKGDHLCVFGDFGSCAKAMNAGYAASTEPFVFLGNDDLRFEQDWDVPALEALSEDGKHVCGLNDGHGRMTSFSMVRRSFIDEHSGVFDQPATLCHEYLSQYVDTELYEYAQHRGVWTQAPDAMLEHLHHDYGKADPGHPNYVKARKTCATDHQTFVERSRAWRRVTA